ncbi:DUF4159 domain-containing protein [bacterium]|nr:DUF4159 domain-containing protein [bacterium]
MSVLFCSHHIRWLWFTIAGIGISPLQISAQTPTADSVRDAVLRGRAYLTRNQQSDGSFPADGVLTHPVAVTSLATLALLNSSPNTPSPSVSRGLRFLKSLPADQPTKTNEIALMIMVLCAADREAAFPRVQELTDRLLVRQSPSGGWRSLPEDLLVESSLTHLALLALRDAHGIGVMIPHDVWEKTRLYWHAKQNSEGSWGLPADEPHLDDHGVGLAAETMTAVSALSICDQMLAISRRDQSGIPECCTAQESDRHLKRGLSWLQSRFREHSRDDSWKGVIYRLYGLERSSGWQGPALEENQELYWKGAYELLQRQNESTGSWQSNDPIVGTSHALLFLARGLESVLVNKLRYGPRSKHDSLDLIDHHGNPHPGDIDGLLRRLAGTYRWPRLMTAGEMDLSFSPADNLQPRQPAPVLYMTGTYAPQLTALEIAQLRESLYQGSLLFAVAACHSSEFEEGFRRLLIQLLPPGEGTLSPLASEHPIYRSQYQLSPRDFELYGTDMGCRTPIVFCRDDLGCLWTQGSNSSATHLTTDSELAFQLGANVLAYATGQVANTRLDNLRPAGEKREDPLDDRLLRILQIQHSGHWNTASRALPHLIDAVNAVEGPIVSTQQLAVPLSSPQLFQHALLYMHGSGEFTFSDSERRALKLHLERGGFLFADACCGSTKFDSSLRTAIKQTFPNQILQQIPLEHKLYSTKIGYDLRGIRRTTKEKRTIVDSASSPSAPDTESEPFSLEGILLDGRYAVIYSRHDISCALDRHTSNRCSVYSFESAVQIATNIMLYALMQDLRLQDSDSSSQD